MICEESDDYNSKNYKHYKPYRKRERGYDWHDYFKFKMQNGVVIEQIPGTCHMCDIRETGCMDSSTPRYYCKKDKIEIQTKLGDY